MKESTSNHMKAPQSAAFVAKMRNVFGNENVKVLYVKEGEVELGEKQPEGAPCFTTNVLSDGVRGREAYPNVATETAKAVKVRGKAKTGYKFQTAESDNFFVSDRSIG